MDLYLFLTNETGKQKEAFTEKKREWPPIAHRNKMALVTRLQASVKSEPTNDITRNLPSLQFESALTEEERLFLDLRVRNHAISVTQCALITVMTDIFKKAR